MAMLADPIVQRIRQENESLRESGELHRQRIRMLRKARRTDRQKSDPYKKKPGADKKTGGLTKKQRAYNKRVNSSRVAIEHVIGNLKQYKRLTDPYDGTKEEYNDELNAIAGMVNQDLMWDEIKLRDADLLKRLAEERARL